MVITNQMKLNSNICKFSNHVQCKINFFDFFSNETSQVSPGPQGEKEIRSHFATLTVLVPPEKPRILQGDFMLTSEGKDIELVCISIGGKPAAKVRVITMKRNVI